MSQPLVSQHLRALRQSGLVTATRDGKEVRYSIADHHVTHVVSDTLAHVREDHPSGTAGHPSREDTS